MRRRDLIELGIAPRVSGGHTTHGVSEVETPHAALPAPAFIDPSDARRAARLTFLAASMWIQLLLIGGFVVWTLLTVPEGPMTPPVRAFVALDPVNAARPAPPPPPRTAPPPSARTAEPSGARPPSLASLSRIDLMPDVDLSFSVDASLDGLAPFDGSDGVPGGVPAGVVGGLLGGPPAPSPPPAEPPRVLRVGGEIRAPEKLVHVDPVYPALAAGARVEGVVILEATIGACGKVQALRVLRSVPLLDDAAVDAVRRWEYAPTVIAGVPVPILMTVTVSFELG